MAVTASRMNGANMVRERTPHAFMAMISDSIESLSSTSRVLKISAHGDDKYRHGHHGQEHYVRFFQGEQPAHLDPLDDEHHPVEDGKGPENISISDLKIYQLIRIRECIIPMTS